jgi:CubicO group peptidase (beta-lactamase class C family)
MMVNHLADEQQVLPGVGFGIGFGIDLNPAKSEILCTPGEISWGGAANTFFWIDPAEDMIYMVWTQLFPWGIYDFRHQFRIMVHAAIID